MEIDKIQQEMNMLSDRLSTMMQSTSVKRTQLQTLENCILDTENAYRKIIDSSNALLGVLKRETKAFDSKHNVYVKDTKQCFSQKSS
jgi:prophage DNA circulation protein